MADKKKAEKAEAVDEGNDIPKSSLTSAVTTDMSDEPASQVRPDEEQAAIDNTFEGRSNRASIGLVTVDGIDLRYVGVAPARDQDAETPSGLKITSENSTFTPLANVEFHPSIRCKDPKSGEYYFPADGVTSWEGCEFEGNPLVPKAEKTKAKKAA